MSLASNNCRIHTRTLARTYTVHNECGRGFKTLLKFCFIVIFINFKAKNDDLQDIHVMNLLAVFG